MSEIAVGIGAGVLVAFISRFKCLFEIENCTCKSCKVGVLESNIVDDHEVEYKKISVNANDVLYMSKNTMKIDDDDDSDDDKNK
jgi:hypothetical protein